MARLVEVLEPLSPEARARAIGWITQALDISIQADGRASEKPTDGTAGLAHPVAGEFKAFAELFHAASPGSEKEKALLAGFWIQRSTGVDQFNAQQINAELK